MPHYLLSYTLAPDYMERRGALRDPHLQLGWDASAAGELLLGGALEEPVDQALLVFTSAAAAEAFARADPYVIEGLVTEWSVRPWRTVLGEGAAEPVRAS
jgi:uncharacterized protein